MRCHRHPCWTPHCSCRHPVIAQLRPGRTTHLLLEARDPHGDRSRGLCLAWTSCTRSSGKCGACRTHTRRPSFFCSHLSEICNRTRRKPAEQQRHGSSIRTEPGYVWGDRHIAMCARVCACVYMWRVHVDSQVAAARASGSDTLVAFFGFFTVSADA